MEKEHLVLVYSTKEVIDQIKHLDEMNQKYAQRYEVFYDKFCSIDDGNASQRAVEAVLNKERLHLFFIRRIKCLD